LLQTYHPKDEMVIPIRRNSEADEVAKEGKCDSEDSDIMSHHTDGEAW
jgi:hypothetical protein